MSELALPWLLRTACAGAVVLLLGWLLLRRQADAARQQRLGEWALIAALFVPLVAALPSWLLLPAPWPAAPVVTETVVAPAAVVEADDLPLVEDWNDAWQQAPADPLPAVPMVARPGWRSADVVVGGYAAVAGALLLRWLAANLALRWLLRSRRPVPVPLAELFTEMAPAGGVRLVVSSRVQVPFSFGLVRGTVVLPARLVEQATTRELRWVLAHELTHLERQDTRVSWLFALGQIAYFYLPWFWWLRRRVRLCQEHIADAAAVRWADAPADYAQFLLSWAGRPIAASTGVSGTGSDLYRRVKTMLQSPLTPPSRPSHGWLIGVAGSLLALAILAGGVGLRARAAEENKAEPKKAEPAPAEPKKEKAPRAPRFDLDEFFPPLAPGLDPEALKQMRQQMEQARRQMEQALQQMERGGAVPGFPGAFGGFGGFDGLTRPQNRPEPRLGAQVRKPTGTLVDQLELPEGQGLVLEEVGPNSAAAKAGLKQHDILLELNGKPVSNQAGEFVKQLRDIKANTPVDAVVLRKGKKETVKGLTLPEAKEQAADPNRPAFRGFPGGLLGGGARGATTLTRNNDEFTVRHRSGDVTYTIQGSVQDGKAKIRQVVIESGNQSQTYDRLDKVPAEHRERVEKLATMAARGTVRFPLN